MTDTAKPAVVDHEEFHAAASVKTITAEPYRSLVSQRGLIHGS